MNFSNAPASSTNRNMIHGGLVDLTEMTDQMKDYFPYALSFLPTGGIGHGILVKFRTFYLKIYNHGRENAYVTEGWVYHHDAPVFVHSIPYNQFGAFAEQMDKDDYLHTLPVITWQCPGPTYLQEGVDNRDEDRWGPI